MPCHMEMAEIRVSPTASEFYTPILNLHVEFNQGVQLRPESHDIKIQKSIEIKINSDVHAYRVLQACSFSS